MATYGNTQYFTQTGTVMSGWFRCSEAVKTGDILIMGSATNAGKVRPGAALGANLTSAGIDGGIVGVAMNDAQAEDMVEVALFTSLTGVYLNAKANTTLDPGLSAIGRTPSTLYVLTRLSNGEWRVDLDTTTNGVARVVGLDTTDNSLSGVTVTGGVGVQGGWGGGTDGGDGTGLKVVFPPSVRYWAA